MKSVKMFTFTIVIAAALILGGSALDSTKCQITDPEVDKCVLNALNSLKPETLAGDQKNGIPSFDPYIIPLFEATQETSMANYTAVCRNTYLRGMDNYKVKEVSFDPKTLTFSGTVEYKSIRLDCDYKIEGHVVSIPLSGKGTVQGIIGPINAKVEVYGELADKTLYKPTKMKIRMEIDDIALRFDGLFADNPPLARLTHAALKESTKLVAAGVAPALDKVAEAAFLQSIRRLAKRIFYV